MGRSLRWVVTFITTVVLTASLSIAAAVPAAAQGTAADATAPDGGAAIEEFLDILTEEIERSDELITTLDQALRQGYPAFVVPPDRIIELTIDEVNVLVAYSKSRGGVFADVANQFRLAEMFAQARDLGRGLKLGSGSDLATEEEFETYWEQLTTIYTQAADSERDHRESLVSVLDGLVAIAEEAGAIAPSHGSGELVATPGTESGNDPDAAPAPEEAVPPLVPADGLVTPGSAIDLRTDFALDIGPYEGLRCVFDPATVFRRDLESDYTVIAYQASTFDDGGPDITVNGAFPDPARYPDEPLRNLRKIEENVAAAVADGARPVFRGSWPAFCAWAERTCPGVVPAIC